MIWFVHFTVITVLLFISLKTKKKKFFIVPSFLYALFVFGQRWMTGTDFPNYLRYYLTDFQVGEPIYRFIQNFLADNELYFGILIFIVFGITLYNNYRFILKFDQQIVFILYFYLLSEIYFAQMSQIRQFAAISFFINAYYYSFERKAGKSLLNLLLGAGFHSSILFMTPILLIHLNIDRIKALYLVLLASILPLLDVTILLKLPYFDRYSHYVQSRFNVNLSIFHYFKFYALILLVLIYFWNLKKYRKNRVEQLIFNGILLNMLIYGFSFQFAPMIRISSFFKIFEVVFLVYYWEELTNYAKPLIKTVVVSFFISIFMGTVLTDPYQTNQYEFERLRIRHEKTESELREEITEFKENY